MIQSIEDYENLVEQILSKSLSGSIPKSSDFPSCTDNDFREVMNHISQEEYLIGWKSGCCTSDGKVHGHASGTPFVTLKGLDFIEQRRHKTAFQKAEAAERRAWISIVIAAVAVVGSADSICRNVLLIFNLFRQLIT